MTRQADRRSAWTGVRGSRPQFSGIVGIVLWGPDWLIAPIQSAGPASRAKDWLMTQAAGGLATRPRDLFGIVELLDSGNDVVVDSRAGRGESQQRRVSTDVEPDLHAIGKYDYDRRD